LDAENYNIGLNVIGVERDSWDYRKTSSEELCVLVIHREPLWTLIQRNKTGGGEHSRLTHSASQHLTNTPAAFDEFARSNNDGPHGSSEAFAQTELNGIALPGDGRHVFAQIRRGIENPRTIHVDQNSKFMGLIANFFDSRSRINRSACHVMRVVQGN